MGEVESRLLRALHFVIVAASLFRCCQLASGNTSGSGAESSNVTCKLPLNFNRISRYNRSLGELLQEGKCYLSCLSHSPLFEPQPLPFQVNSSRVTLYPPWPFVEFNDSITSESAFTLTECALGCTIYNPICSRDENIHAITCCADDCKDCSLSCYNSPTCNYTFFMDTWSPKPACHPELTSQKYCFEGCHVGQDMMNQIALPVLPPAPAAPPILEESFILSDSSRNFAVNLTEAAALNFSEDNTTMGPYLTGFVYQIHNVDTNSTAYVWQNDPRDLLDLTEYMCHQLEVSFAPVTQDGRANFSEPAEVFVKGDPRLIPSVPQDLRVEEMRDLRLGYFPFLVLNVTWAVAEEEGDIDYFLVALEDETNGTVLSTMVCHTSSYKQYSVTLLSNKSMEGPMPGHRYTVKVTAVALDGNESAHIIHSTRSLQDYSAEFVQLSCNQIIAINDTTDLPYSIFETKWKLASNLLPEDFIHNFSLVGGFHQSINGSLSSQHSEIVSSEANRTTFLEDMARSDIFEIALSINWNLQVINSAPLTYRCNISSTSLPPSQVINLTLDVSNGDNGMDEIQVSWLPPQQLNGVLIKYVLCFLIQPLEAFQNIPENQGYCKNISANSTSTPVTEDDLNGSSYIQIYPRNTEGRGQWSNALNVSEFMVDPDPTDTTESISTSSATTKTSADGGLGSSEVIIIAICIFAPLILVILIALLIYFIRNQAKKMRLLRMTDTPIPNVVPMRSFKSIETTFIPRISTLEVGLEDEWELYPSDVTMGSMLGEGAFGLVYKGYLKGPLTNTKVKPEFRNQIHIPIAMKLLKDSTRGSERISFLAEIEMMKKVSEGHNPHVVAMLGCVTTQEPLCLITEYVEYGDLLSYLRSSRNLLTGLNGNVQAQDPYIKLGKLTQMDLPSFSYQIAAGMAYLSSIGIVHRDLACRNVLVNADKALKITDFGLSREAEEIYVQQSMGRVPYKWMALESILAREFTSASDVWSYGIVLWEVGTIGGVPYPGVSNSELVSYLKSGQRMEKPDGCSDEIYQVMRACWQDNPTKRPTFNGLKSKFNDILLNLGSESYIDFNHIDPSKPCYDINLDDMPDLCMDLPEFEMDFLDLPSRDSTRSHSLSNPATPILNSRQRKSSLPHLLSRLFDTNLPQSKSMERFKTKLCSPMAIGEENRASSLVLPVSTEQQEKVRDSSSDRSTGRSVDRYIANPYEVFMRSVSTGLDGDTEEVHSRKTITTGAEH